MESCALRERGLTSGTWSNKVSHLRSYITFTTYFGVPDFPVHLGILLRFIALLARGSLAQDYASSIISNVKWFALLLDPSSAKVFDAILVSSSLKGLKAQLSRPVRQKLPFTIAHLYVFYNLLELNNVNHLACWCAMLLAFYGCFRLSNLVPISKNKFDPLKQLTRGDIKFEKGFMLVCFKWSKTNQNCGKVSWVPICPVKDDRFSVKHYFQKLFSIVKVSDDAPLFSVGRNKFHSRHSLVRLLDKCVFKADLSPSDYSWHSFRRGSAVFAFELGLADSAVQLLGDWSSSAFKNYLEFSFMRKMSIASDIAKHFLSEVKRL